MIFKNDSTDRLPDSKDMRYFLAMVQSRIPVQHIMPFERIVGDSEAYVLTRLSNGRFSIKPNITHQGVLYYGNCNFDAIKDGLRFRYYQKSKEDQNSVHRDLLEANVNSDIKSFHSKWRYPSILNGKI